MCSITLIYWLPFGFQVFPTFEEWKMLDISMHASSIKELIAQGMDRPLIVIPYFIGYIISPYEVYGINLVQFLSILISTYLIFLITFKLSGDILFSFISAIIFLVYPADVGRFTTRVLPIHTSSAFLLASFYLAIKNWDVEIKWYRLFFISILQLIGLAIYDGGVFLVLAISPLFFLSKNNIKYIIGINWIIVPVVILAFVMYNTLYTEGYQANLLDRGVGLTSFIPQAISSIRLAYEKIFFFGWFEYYNFFLFNNIYRLILVIALFTLFFITANLFVFNKLDLKILKPKIWYLKFFSVTFILSGIAYSIWVFSSVWRNSSFRVFIFSSIVASIAISAFLRFFLNGSKILNNLFLLAGFSLSLLGFVSSYAQQDFYRAAGDKQGEVAKEVLKITNDSSLKNVVIVYGNQDNQFLKIFNTCTFMSDCLNWSSNYLRGNNSRKNYYVCSLGKSNTRESCEFTQNEVIFLKNAHNVVLPQVNIPYKSTKFLYVNDGIFKDINSPDLLIYSFKSGFYEWEGDKINGYIWSSGNGKLTFFNPTNNFKKLYLKFNLSSLHDTNINIFLNSSKLSSQSIGTSGKSFEYDLILSPGDNTLSINSETPALKISTDPRVLSYSMSTISGYFKN